MALHCVSNCLQHSGYNCRVSYSRGAVMTWKKTFNKESLSASVQVSSAARAHIFVTVTQTDGNTQALVQSYYYLCRHSSYDIFCDSLLGNFMCACLCSVHVREYWEWKSNIFLDSVSDYSVWGWNCLHSKEWRLLDSSYFCQLSVRYWILVFRDLFGSV